MSEFDGADCIQTFEQSKADLEAIEQKLAKRFGIKDNIRATLIIKDLAGTLIEYELVADWHEAYSCYVDWLKNP
jgi:hypothetical protein